MAGNLRAGYDANRQAFLSNPVLQGLMGQQYQGQQQSGGGVGTALGALGGSMLDDVDWNSLF